MLLVLNGAPAVGKSTLARRYADEHALALLVDIDVIRTHLGQWDRVDESRVVARDLAAALVRDHLLSGHDVVVPQYLGRREFPERLQRIAMETGSPFVEVVLTDQDDEIARRFFRRRSEYAATGVEHPEADLADDAVVRELAEANERLVRAAVERGAAVVAVGSDPEISYQSLCAVLSAAP